MPTPMPAPATSPGSAPTPVVVAEPIRTARLLLAPLRAEHADVMAGVLGDPALHTFIGGAPVTVTELRARYERMLAGPADPAVSWCNWVVLLREDGSPGDGIPVGTVQATVTEGDPRTAEVAWVIGTPWQGRGIARESARALVDWLWDRPVDRVIAHVHPEHHASAAVAAWAGLAPTDVLQDGEVRHQADR